MSLFSQDCETRQMLTADAGIGIGLTPNISAFLFIIYASHLHRDAAADSAACYQRNRAMATRRNLKFFFRLSN